MKMHNFTIRGNCLEIVGRIERREGKNVPVYDIEFPEGVGGMSVQELRELVIRIEEDIDDLFYKYEKERSLKLSFDLIDKIIDNVKTVALRRF